LTGREHEYIARAIGLGWIAGDGHFTRQCSKYLEARLGVPRVLLTTSCTHALEMAALLLELGPGDEVIMPAFTFVSCPNAFALRGATPVFADVRGDTMNLDETRLEELITPRTRAILVVHYAGVGCEMDTILEIAARHGLVVIEDNAHGLYARYRGRNLGTFGALSTNSFHETKNVTCGEGGALVLNDTRYLERAEIVREKGTDRSRFYRGQVDKYTWVGLGSSYLPSEVLAAFLYSQLEASDEIQERRRRVWEYYRSRLEDWASNAGVQMPHVPKDCEQSYHMFYMVLPSLDYRQSFLAHLRGQGIQAVFHYQPLHLSAMGKALGRHAGCPVTERVADCLVRLPFYNTLELDSQQRVVDAVTSFQP
jgi:dTDP-4-amino-4,6-dideoxygalactose transaminase